VTKYTSDGSNFGADGPFFRIIREGLEGLADGEDYFDLLARVRHLRARLPQAR
jgi:uncharacterized protein